MSVDVESNTIALKIENDLPISFKILDKTCVRREAKEISLSSESNLDRKMNF